MTALVNIAEITSVNPDECYIMVFDREMNFLGQRKPKEGEPVVSTELILGKPVFDRENLTITVPVNKPIGTVQMMSVGLRDWDYSNVFQLKAHQVDTGLTFTFLAKFDESEIVKETAYQFANVPVEPQQPDEPAPNKGAVYPPTALIDNSDHLTGITRWNPEIFYPVVEWNDKGKAKVTDKVLLPESHVMYFVNGGEARTDLPQGFVFQHGDEIVIYKVANISADVYHADWVIKGYAQILFIEPKWNS